MRRTAIVSLLLVLTAATAARADDWPQWLGPRRDGVLREAGTADAFPPGGPPVRWRAPVSEGYSGPAVAGGRVFVTDRVPGPKAVKPASAFDRATLPGVERVLCFDERDGKQLWAHQYDCPYTISYSAGPRATPTVDGDRVYALGAEGHLTCLDAATGKVHWQLKLGGGADTPMWGYAGHPLVDGDRLFVLTAGKGAVATALDKHTGKVLWTALSAKEPGYAPPMVYEVAGRRVLFVWHTEALSALDPATGKVFWTVPFGPVQYGLSIVPPTLLRDPKLGDLLYIASENEGSLMLKLGAAPDGTPTQTTLWKRAGRSGRNSDSLHILMSPPVLRDGHVYGVDSHGQLRCLNAATGDRLWETADATTYDAGPQKWSTAFLTPLGDTGSRFLIANEHGDLILADLSPAGFKLVATAHVLDPTNTDAHRPVIWCAPAYANRSVFWRNDKELVCVSLAAAPAR